ncbi:MULTISPECIES: acyl-CoA carboxylase subunit epsilon [unclassified Salinibacterium]|uniref:acyl-CoA carboxylase subunit epsilon n=1 Tax=unclassified Salinibacterium TaxID=2632331 RepID=UPI001422BC3E|nr:MULTISPECIES: acyl-CoA carboxylase subunit epsilon [unclassified Salinibacterium]
MTETPDAASAIRVTAGNPSPEELAAVTAVMQAALDELAGVHRVEQTAPSSWERGRRPLRTPLERGAWTTWGS